MVKFALFCSAPDCGAHLVAGTTPVPLRAGWRRAYAPGLEEEWSTCPEHPQAPGEGFLVWDHAGVPVEGGGATWRQGEGVYVVSVDFADSGDVGVTTLWRRRPDGGHELIGQRPTGSRDIPEWIRRMAQGG